MLPPKRAAGCIFLYERSTRACPSASLTSASTVAPAGARWVVTKGTSTLRLSGY